MVLQGPKESPREAQHGANRKRDQKKRGDRTDRTHSARRGKRNDQTKTHPEPAEDSAENPGKQQNGTTEARTEKAAHGTSSETSTRAPTPQREETTHIQARPPSHAHNKGEPRTEREDKRRKGTN